MKVNTTIVTSLYDIDRKKLDGRGWDEYLEWFSQTLKIKNPMVIFVDESLERFVLEKRGNLETRIITQDLRKIPYYHLKDRMDNIISGDYKNLVKDPNRIECKSSLYTIVQFSKFGWVEAASEINPFKTDYFLWLDAGISRFFESNGVNLESYFSVENFKKNGIDLDGKITIQMFMTYYPDLANSSNLSRNYLLDNRSFVAGGIFMIPGDSISAIKKEVDSVFVSDMLDCGIVNNEQIVLGYLSKKMPEYFNTFKHYHHTHSNYEILKFLQA